MVRNIEYEERWMTYPFVKVVTSELNRRVRDYPNAIGTIAPHKSSPSFLFADLHKSLPYR